MFYSDVAHMVQTGLRTKFGNGTLKGEIVPTETETEVKITEVKDTQGATTGSEETKYSKAKQIKELATAITNQIRAERTKLKAVKDRLIQHMIKNDELTLVISPSLEYILENDARYNIFADSEAKKASVSGALDGTPIVISKQLPEGID